MNCPQCRERGRHVGGMTTDMAVHEFTDDAGRHVHDMNDRLDTYRCPEGHTWDVTGFPPCPIADCYWNAPKTAAAPAVGETAGAT